MVTGFAVGHINDAVPAWGVWKLPSGGIGLAGMAFENELLAAFEKYQPRKVGYEAPLVAGQQSNAQTAEVLIGLAVVTEIACARWEIQCVRRASQTLRSNVCGRVFISDEERRAKLTVKTAIVAPWIKSMGWDIPDHNACDAAVGWYYEIGGRHPSKQPKQRRAA